MTALLIILAIALCMIGILGCFLPGLPGPPLNYLAMWVLQWAFPGQTFELLTLIVYGILTVLIFILDYWFPIWFAKKFGATRQGIMGSIIGMVVGFLFSPIGMLLGTIAGAIIGDMVAGRNRSQASRSGIATFFGTLVSIVMKVLLSGIMTSLIFYKIIFHFLS